MTIEERGLQDDESDSRREQRFHVMRPVLTRSLVSLLFVTALLVASTLFAYWSTRVSAQEPLVRDLGVLQRQSLMKTAKTALGTLHDMSAMRTRFDKLSARSAKTQLVATLKQIPNEFTKPYMDAHTRARPEIWQNWDAFSRDAASAHRAAKRIRTNNLGALRRSLPPMMSACLSCHSTYRKPK